LQKIKQIWKLKKSNKGAKETREDFSEVKARKG